MDNYHFIGIKGSGMSSLAIILSQMGYKVSGSDINDFTFTQIELENNNINVSGFDKKNITPDKIIVKGNVFDESNIEVEEAINQKNKIFSYPEMVQKIISKNISIAVAGSHGKTSTVGLLANALSSVRNTSYLIGDGTGKGKKESDFFVFEADEYRRHFKDYTPDYSVITNIDFDHPDYYKNIDDVKKAFLDFSNNTNKKIIVWGDDRNSSSVNWDKDKLITFGFEKNNDYYASEINKTTSGSTFSIFKKNGEKLGVFKTPTFGNHGILNSLSVIIVLLLNGIKSNEINNLLQSFKGVKRRFTEKNIGDNVLIDDYAHHPEEILATLNAAKQKYPNKKIIAIFQPHTFSRVIAYKHEFASTLDNADEVYLTKIFSSPREHDDVTTSNDIANLSSKFKKLVDEKNINEILQEEDSVYIFMGAGDILKLETPFEEIISMSTKKNF